MKAKMKSPVFWLALALVLIIISGIGASATESSGYSVKIDDITMTWAQMANETRQNAEKNNKDVVVTYDGSNGGKDMSASTLELCFKLLIPETATASNPAPAVVSVHGFYNNKEMQDAYYVELARRGYVVIALDMAGHGNSNATFAEDANIIAATENCGMEACVEWLMSQSYVDENNIGVTGHSQGGRACGWTIQNLMRAGHGDYIKSALLQANSAGATAVMSEFGDFVDGMTIGVIMCRYDEFSIVRDNSYEYLGTDQAKSIIKTAYPEFEGNEIEAATFYTSDGPTNIDIANGETIQGDGAVIYWPWIIHPYAHFSTECAGYGVEFFYATLGIPSGTNFISPSNQIWPIKEIFNLVGLIGFFLMIVPITTLLVQYVPVFKRTRRQSVLAGTMDLELVELKGWRRQLTFWGCGLLTALFTTLIFQPLFSNSSMGNVFFPASRLYPQLTSNTIGMWSFVCGIITLLMLVLFWIIGYALNRKNKAVVPNPFASARLESVSDFLRALLLAVTVVALLYVVVFAQYYIWGTDFRIWYFAVLPFKGVKLPTIIRYVPFFAVFYVANAIANANNRFKNVKEWVSVLLSSVFSIIGLATITIIQYSTMVNQGHQAYSLIQDESVAITGAMGYILLLPIMVCIVLANIISRKIYKKTGNVWIGGLINGILFTFIFCANTFTQYNYFFI